MRVNTEIPVQIDVDCLFAEYFQFDRMTDLEVKLHLEVEETGLDTPPVPVEVGSHSTDHGEDRSSPSYPSSPVATVGVTEGGAACQNDPRTFAKSAALDSSNGEKNVPIILPVQEVAGAEMARSVVVTGVKGKCASLDAGSEYVFLKTSVSGQNVMCLTQSLVPGKFLPLVKKLEIVEPE